MNELDEIAEIEEIDKVFSSLTPKERTLVQHWSGSAKATWTDLEKSHPGQFSKPFVRDVCNDIRVIRAVRIYSQMGSPGILTNMERQQFWSKVVVDEEQRMTDRLKASELLGKAHQDFVEKIEVDATKEFATQLMKARERLKEVTVEVADSPRELE